MDATQRNATQRKHLQRRAGSRLAGRRLGRGDSGVWARTVRVGAPVGFWWSIWKLCPRRTKEDQGEERRRREEQGGPPSREAGWSETGELMDDRRRQKITATMRCVVTIKTSQAVLTWLFSLSVGELVRKLASEDGIVMIGPSRAQKSWRVGLEGCRGSSIGAGTPSAVLGTGTTGPGRGAKRMVDKKTKQITETAERGLSTSSGFSSLLHR